MLAFLVFLFEALFVASKMLETDYDYTVEEASDMLESGRYAMLSEREQLDYATAYMNATDETTASIQDETETYRVIMDVANAVIFNFTIGGDGRPSVAEFDRAQARFNDAKAALEANIWFLHEQKRVLNQLGLEFLGVEGFERMGIPPPVVQPRRIFGNVF